MRRGLPQSVVEEGRFQEVSLQTTFRFECKRCGRCCFLCEIVLTPFDILHLCQFLQMSTSAFLCLFARIYIGPESGLPVCTLDFERVCVRRGGDPEIAPCPFLTVTAGRPACGVYPARPGCCRSYPLGRMVRMEESGGQKPILFLQEINCPAAQTQRVHTVAEWIEHEGLAEYQQVHNCWLAQVMALSQTQKGWPPQVEEGLINLWYNFSVCRGEGLQEKYETAMEGSRRIVEKITNVPLPQVSSISVPLLQVPPADDLLLQASLAQKVAQVPREVHKR